MEETANQRLKIFRERTGIDIIRLANDLEVSQAHIYKIQREETPVTAKLIAKACKVYGISALWLTDGSGSMFAIGSEEANIARIRRGATEIQATDTIHELLAAEKRRADILEKNNSFLLDLLGKLTNGKGLELANFLTAPEINGMVPHLKAVA